MKKRFVFFLSVLLIVMGCENGEEAKPTEVVEGTECLNVNEQEYATLHILRGRMPDCSRTDYTWTSDDQVIAGHVRINQLRAWAQTLPDLCIRASYLSWLDHYQEKLKECVMIGELQKATPVPPEN